MGHLTCEEISSLVLFAILLASTAFCSITNRDSSFAFMLLPYLAFLPVVGCGVKAKDALSGIGWGGAFFATSCVSIGTVGSAVGFASWFSGVNHQKEG